MMQSVTIYYTEADVYRWDEAISRELARLGIRHKDVVGNIILLPESWRGEYGKRGKA